MKNSEKQLNQSQNYLLRKKMLRRVFTLILLSQSFVWAVYANTLTITEQGNILAETDRYIALFEKGALVHFHNKLTEETYTRDDVVQETDTVFYTTTAGIWTTTQPVIQQISPTRVEIFYQNDLSLHFTIEIDPVTSDLLISQEGFAPNGGAVQAMWTFKNLSHAAASLILPGQGGIILKGEIPHDKYDYPGSWEAQLAIVQGQSGGMFVRADDADFRFKNLEYKSGGNDFRINFSSTVFAPFKDKERVVSAPWRLNAYEGDWQVPAKMYRDWMHETFQPPDRRQMPAWVDEIEFVVKNQGHLDVRMLSRLSELIDPKTTLLYLYNWHQDGVDSPYSTGDVDPNLEVFVEAAQRYGFKVKPHMSLIAVRETNPFYQKFERYQARDPYTNERMGWRWNDPTYPYRPAYINPASQEYRDMYVNEVKLIWDTYGVDAVQLDISTKIINDNNGLIDGLTWAEGNIELHHALREAMLDLVMTGEHIHEVTFIHENFADIWTVQHPYPHPITVFLFSPYVRLFGFLPNEPDRDKKIFQEYFDVSQEFGFLPTLLIWGLESLDEDKVETHRLLALVRERQNYVYGDVNGDLIVNILDLVLIAQALGEPKIDPVLDVNKDGVINILDLVIVSQNL